MNAPPKKTGILICAHCRHPIKHERVQLSHFFGPKESVTLNFCGPDCMKEHLYDEDIRNEIDEVVTKEVLWLHRQVCPSCRRRIT